MKKLLLGSITLLIFATSVLIIQVSCSKTVARPLDNITPIGKIIFTKYSSDLQIWTANYDGTGASQVPIVLPADVEMSLDNLTNSLIRLSPDGQKIFFQAHETRKAGSFNSIYSCNVDGSNVAKIIDSDPAILKLGGAY